jgi:hypothetical protein
MVPDRNVHGGRHRRKAGAHKKARKRRSALSRTVAAGGAALAIGAAYNAGAPTAAALSILLPGPTVDGETNITQINLFEGIIFNPQFGIGGSASNNNVIGNIAMELGNQIIKTFLDFDINFGPAAAGNGNVTQVNLFSYNIFNPQISLGPNVSNNTTISNVAMNNGNNSTTQVTGGLPLFGGAMGNGNTVQFSLFSGNIFNPQWSIGGNVSNNTAITNVAVGNGNNSQTAIGFGGLFGNFLFGGGNGNTLQFGLFTSNIYNPQWSLGGGNVSNNTASTNTSTDNGNSSTTVISGSGGIGTVVTGVTGNGQTNQVATGSGNIWNDQVNVGPNLTAAVSSNNTVTTDQQQIVGLVTVGSNDADVDITTMRETESNAGDLVPSDPAPADSNDNPTANQEETPAPATPDTTPPSNDPVSGPINETGGDGGGDPGGSDGGE